LVEEYLDKLAVALEQIARRHAVRIHIIPQVTAGFRDSDRRVSLALRERLAGRVGHVAVIDADLVAADLKQLYGRLHVLIGSRMHSAILAMLAGTPTLGLAYQPKTVGVFAFTGLDDWVLDIAEFAADDLAGRLHRILTDLAAARQRVRAAAVTAQAAVADAFRRELAPWLGGTVPAPPDSRP
jgi:colanic acid/amylovoran biosynthesis protein